MPFDGRTGQLQYLRCLHSSYSTWMRFVVSDPQFTYVPAERMTSFAAFAVNGKPLKVYCTPVATSLPLLVDFAKSILLA